MTQEGILLKSASKVTIELTDSELAKLILLCETFGIDYKLKERRKQQSRPEESSATRLAFCPKRG